MLRNLSSALKIAEPKSGAPCTVVLSLYIESEYRAIIASRYPLSQSSNSFGKPDDPLT
jgi:hypothetical protein